MAFNSMLWYHFNNLLIKKNKIETLMEKNSSKLLKLLLLLLLCSWTDQQQYLYNFSVKLPMPWDAINVFSGNRCRMVVVVKGATEYKHISYTQGWIRNPPGIEDANFYRDDSYSTVITQEGYAKSVVYVKVAPGLVKVQIAGFINDVKKTQYFGLVSQYSRGFFFLEVQSTKSCRIKVVTSSSLSGFTIFEKKEDAFNENLTQLSFSTSIVNVSTPKKYYLRFYKSPAGDLTFLSGEFINIVSLDNTCQHSCKAGPNNLYSVATTASDHCYCQYSIWDRALKICSDCTSGSTRKECTQMDTFFCGNGVKEGSEECDNGNDMGCYFCKVDIGFYCTEDSNRYSSCSSRCGDGIKAMDQQCDSESQVDSNICGNGIRETNEQCDNRKGSGCQKCLIQSGFICSEDGNKFSTCLNQSENNSRKIIIGACVGVGSAIIVGLSIFLIVKYLKAKALTVQLAESTKVNINHGPEVEARRQPETITVINL